MLNKKLKYFIRILLIFFASIVVDSLVLLCHEDNRGWKNTAIIFICQNHLSIFYYDYQTKEFNLAIRG